MQFPKLLLITDVRSMTPTFDAALLNACLGGAKWIHLRDKEASPRQLIELFARAQRITEKFGAKLFLNGRADIARTVHAEGLHLPEQEIPVSAARLTLGFHTPCGVSIHSLEGAKRAVIEGADYLVFGPVFPTTSHPETKAVGLDALREVASAVEIPVFAVGGVTASTAGSCIEAGAAGVAVVSAVWAATDIKAAVRELRAALGEKDEPLHGHGAREDETSKEAPKTGLAQLLGRSDIILGNGNGASQTR